jgi:CheY-like chemotaxis protein
MGGRVGMASEPGQGSTFWIELPRIGTPELPVLDRGSVAPAGVHAVTGTVLYVEDNAANVRLVEQALSHRPGVTLLTAMVGQLGLELAARHRPDLIVLDLHLPDIPGQDVLVALQSDERTRAIPVLILSADATAGQVDRLLARGARAYMTKPFDVRAFLALVDEHLSGSSSLSG